MVLQVFFPDQTRVWSWYKRDIADLLVFEHAEEVNGKVSAAMQNQTVCSEDNTVDITGNRKKCTRVNLVGLSIAVEGHGVVHARGLYMSASF